MVENAMICDEKLSVNCEYVKSVDFHPSKPWVIASLATGKVMVWDYESGSGRVVRMIQISDRPVQCAKFIAKKDWIVAACDTDVHIFDCDLTPEAAADASEAAAAEDSKDDVAASNRPYHRSFAAHDGSVRCVEVHPELSYILTCSDDGEISLWDWNRDFCRVKPFIGHEQGVTVLKFNPWDQYSFASSSLDRTVKLWDLRSRRFSTLGEHKSGVICVDYGRVQEKYTLLSASTDGAVSIWDLVTKSRVLSVDVPLVQGAIFHPKLAIAIAASENGVVSMYGTSNAASSSSDVNGELGAARALVAANQPKKDLLAIGYDRGCRVIALNGDSEGIKCLLPTPSKRQSETGEEEDQESGERWLLRERERLLPYLGVIVCSLFYCICPTEWGTVIAVPCVVAAAMYLCSQALPGWVVPANIVNIQGTAALNCLVALAIIDDKVMALANMSGVSTLLGSFAWVCTFLMLLGSEVFLLSRIKEGNSLFCTRWAFSIVINDLLVSGPASYLYGDIVLTAMTMMSVWRLALIQAAETYAPVEWGSGAKEEIRRSKFIYGATLLSLFLVSVDGISELTFVIFICLSFVVQAFFTLRSMNRQPTADNQGEGSGVTAGQFVASLRAFAQSLASGDAPDDTDWSGATGSYQPPQIHVAVPVEQVV